LDQIHSFTFVNGNNLNVFRNLTEHPSTELN